MMTDKKEYIRPLLVEVTELDTDVILMSGSVFEPDPDELVKPINSSASRGVFQTPGSSLQSPDRIAPDNISGNSIF